MGATILSLEGKSMVYRCRRLERRHNRAIQLKFSGRPGDRSVSEFQNSLLTGSSGRMEDRFKFCVPRRSFNRAHWIASPQDTSDVPASIAAQGSSEMSLRRLFGPTAGNRAPGICQLAACVSYHSINISRSKPAIMVRILSTWRYFKIKSAMEPLG